VAAELALESLKINSKIVGFVLDVGDSLGWDLLLA
jgi:hypothetical protein